MPKKPQPNKSEAYQKAERRIAEWKKAGDTSEGLDLSYLGLQDQDLPPSLWDLTALTTLELGGNQLTSLPEGLGNLTALTTLYIEGNQLTRLPEGLGNLTALTDLFLSGNQLTSLPESLSNLTALTELNLSENHLTSLPEGLGNLTALTWLYLGGNQLTRLPEGLGNLTALTELNLSENHLTSLPEGLGNLTALTWLDLSENQLTSLPEGLGNLTALTRLYLHGNPGLGLPDELLGPTRRDVIVERAKPADPKVILARYFASQSQEGKPLNEVRIVLVGRGGAGKTSLVQRMVKGTFDPRQPETPGVALSDWVMRDCKGEAVTAHLWDFAGQVITHTMHRYFLGHRTVYLLVLTQREDNAAEDGAYWLNLINSYGTERTAEGEETSGPPVIIALNKWDQGRVKLNREALREQFPFILDFVETDCETGRGIAELQKRLCDLMDDAQVAPWVREGYPARWWQVKENLYKLQLKQPHISYEQFKKLCKDCGEDKPDDVGRDLHTMGIALNYGLDRQWKDYLQDLTVLRPSWVTHHCYSLVRFTENRAGVLYRAEVPDVLSAVRDGVPGEKDSAMHWYLMKLMERFEIAYPLGEDDLWPPMKWLIPLGLPDDQPVGVADFGKVPAQEAARLRYVYPWVPPGLIAQLMVRTHTFQEDKMQWASGTVMTYKGARALVRVTSKTQIEITAIGADQEARRDLAGLCRDEVRALNQQIKAQDVREETEVVAGGERVWANVPSLQKDERKGVKSAVQTDEGTVEVDNTKELNEFDTQEARLPSGYRMVGEGRLLHVAGSKAGQKEMRTVRPHVFISYSHADEKHVDTLNKHLKILKNLGLIQDGWHDRRIQPGMDWDKSIQDTLKKADVVIFLTSAASLASDYINQDELRPALERHVKGEARVVPIILERCHWKETFAASPPLAADKRPNRRVVQGIPRDGLPLRSYKPQREGWYVVAEELKKLFTEVKAGLAEKASKP